MEGIITKDCKRIVKLYNNYLKNSSGGELINENKKYFWTFEDNNRT